MSQNKIVVILIIMLLFSSIFYIIYYFNQNSDPGTNKSLIPKEIWSYQNIINYPNEALMINLDAIEWQTITAVTITPAFINNEKQTPILFNDNSEVRDIEISHKSKNLTDFGNDPVTGTSNIAKAYWTKAEIIIIANNYESILWSIPIASFLSAPILFNPSTSTIQALKVKCAIQIGVINNLIELDKIITLETKEDVWKFQLEIYEKKGLICDYIIITNPKDILENVNPNIYWPYLSLTSAPLAAYRNAIVQTGDYTSNRTAIDKLAQAAKPYNELYEQVKPYFHKVKKDSYDAEKFLMENKHKPKYLAIVGGSYSIPDYIFDFHITYFYWSAKNDYLFSPAPYGDIDSKLEYFEYPQQELEVGRIIGHSIIDVSLQLTRTFFYKDFRSSGTYGALTPVNWENKASVVEGHRINQPNSGGPPWSNDDPYFPAGEVYDIFRKSGYQSTYYLPRNISEPEDNNLPINEILRRALNSSLVLINAHGGSPGKQTLLEIGLDSDTKHEYTFVLDSNGIKRFSIAPSLVYLIGCDTGSTSFYFDKNEYLTLGFIHSGAVAYLAPETYQTVCFWDKAPYGPEASQTIYFFKGLIENDWTIGEALIDAKWKAYNDWMNLSSAEDDVGPLTLRLYGDPAFKPYIINSNGDSKNENVGPVITRAAEQNQDFNGRASTGEKFYSTINLDWDETQTFSGKVSCNNITINNFGRLIIKNADLKVKGIINVSGHGSIFAFNSNIEILTPPLDLYYRPVNLRDNALLRFYNSNVSFYSQQTPTAVPYISSLDSSSILYKNCNLYIKLPPVPREPNDITIKNPKISGTAGTCFFADNTYWKLENTNFNINLNYKKINDTYYLFGAWYMFAVQGDANINLHNIYLVFNTAQNLFESIKGKIVITDSFLECSLQAAGLTELKIINTIIKGDLTLTDQALVSIIDSDIQGMISNGVWYESELEPQTNVEIYNSTLENGIVSGARTSTKLIKVAVSKSVSQKSNSSFQMIDTEVEGVLDQSENSAGSLINSSVKTIKLNDQCQLNLVDIFERIETFITTQNYKGQISIINSEILRFYIYPEGNIEIFLVNASISRVKTYWNSSLTFNLLNSQIIELMNSGGNNDFSFIIENSTIPNITDHKNITQNIKFKLTVNVMQNQLPVLAQVEIYDNKGLVESGYTDNDGKIFFILLNKIIDSTGQYSFEEYSITTTYLGYSEIKSIILENSKEINFFWLDLKSPTIRDIEYNPKTWNSDWDITVEISIFDEEYKLIANATIMYRTSVDTEWKKIPMKNLGEERFEGTIPAQDLGTELQFYVIAYDHAGNSISSPKKNIKIGSELIFILIVLLIIIISLSLIVSKKLITKRIIIKKYYMKYNKDFGGK